MQEEFITRNVKALRKQHKMTLQQLADEYQVSAERIRQLESNAMKKLKASMS